MSAPPENLAVTLARMEMKLDALLTTDSDHEQRIRALEKSRWPVSSASILLALCAVGISAVQWLTG